MIMNRPMLATTASRIASTRRAAPRSAPYALALVVRPASPVVTTIPRPRTGSSSRLRRRALIGFGRRLRGTAHAQAAVEREQDAEREPGAATGEGAHVVAQLAPDHRELRKRRVQQLLLQL